MPSSYLLLTLALAATCLLLLLPGIQAGGFTERGTQRGEAVSSTGKPRNVNVSCLNLNYTLQWQPPVTVSDKNADDQRITFYNVYYYRSWLPDSWVVVPSCVNITTTTCNLVQVFPSYDHIYLDLHVKVHAQNKDGNRGLPVNVTFNPMNDATVSAPSVVVDRVMPLEARFKVTPPVTPFRDDSAPYDYKPITQYLTQSAIKYNMSLWESTGPGQFTKIKDKTLSSSIERIDLDGLDSDTAYRLDVQTSYMTAFATKYSQDIATVFFTTLQRRPSNGPDVSLQSISRPDCRQPNRRDVTINWRAPPKSSWNGAITSYIVFVQEKNSPLLPTRRSSYELPAFQSEFTILNMSRWKAYTISVMASNDAGGTSSAWMAVAPHSIGDLGLSQPENLQVTSLDDDLYVNVTWQPPSNYAECIIGYSLYCKWGSSEDAVEESRTVSILNGTKYQMRLNPSRYYDISVASYIKSGYNNSDVIGLPARTTFYPTMNKKSAGIIGWQPIVAIVIVIFVMSLVIWCCLWKRSTLKRILGLHHKYILDDDNKIIKFAQSYSSSGRSMKHVEPEYFDPVVTTAEHQKLCQKADGGGAVVDLSVITSGCSRHGGGNQLDKLHTEVGRDATTIVSGDSQELPVLTPDIGFSCFHFPEFSRKMIGKELDANPNPNPQKSVTPSLQYLYCKCATKLNPNDYVRGHSEADVDGNSKEPLIESKLEDSMAETECSQLLSGQPDVLRDPVSVDSLSAYCKLSQLPPSAANVSSLSRLNSYGDSEVPSSDSDSCVITEQHPMRGDYISDDTFDSMYEFDSAQNIYKVKDHTPDTTSIPMNNQAGRDYSFSTEVKPTRPSLERADSYPYSKMAIGCDGIPKLISEQRKTDNTESSGSSINDNKHPDVTDGSRKHSITFSDNEQRPKGHPFTGIPPDVTCLVDGPQNCGPFDRTSMDTQVPLQITGTIHPSQQQVNIEPYILISQL